MVAVEEIVVVAVEEIEVAGEVWLRHCSRCDDLLVHTSGEMTNPLPIEAAISAHPAVSAACVLGDKCARAVLVLALDAKARQVAALPAARYTVQPLTPQ